MTSYTPYQPEVSQGTLQAHFEFQSMVCELTDMEVANAGMYDGATSAAEAVLMACRINKKFKVEIVGAVSPLYADVIKTLTQATGIEISYNNIETMNQLFGRISSKIEADSLSLVKVFSESEFF